MKLSKLRQLIQFASTVLSNSYIGTIYTKTVNTNAFKGVCVPFLNCYACPSAVFSCPIGTLQHFAAIRTFPLYLLSFIAVIGLTTGRMACGWLCPFGLLQDIMYKIKTKKIRIPSYLSYVKYFILVFFVIVIPYYTGDLIFSQLCPAGKLTAGIPWALWNPINPATGQRIMPDGPGILFYIGLIILFAFLSWFVISKRPFCRVICPMGALLSLFNSFSIIKLEVNKKCDGCNVCEISCPVDINISMDVDSKECIRCLECTKCGHIKIVNKFSFEEKEVLNEKEQNEKAFD
ncbi:MAG: 4Fe-4S binding protein [Desulfobacterales bacterium]|nr:4Fe-4S binding protein [Desulfobacterales bacterium]